jgi:hypothetical protein
VRRATGRAACGKRKWCLPGLYDFYHLGDHITGALHQDGRTNADRFFDNIVFVMQGGVRDDHTAHGHRLQSRHGGQLTRPAHLNIDTLNNRLGLFGGKLVGNGPAGGAGCRTKAVLPIKTVDFVDNAVDVIGAFTSPRLHFTMIGHHFGNAFTDRVGLHLKAPGRHRRQHTRMGASRQRRYFTPGIGPKAKLTGGGDGRVQLPQ